MKIIVLLIIFLACENKDKIKKNENENLVKCYFLSLNYFSNNYNQLIKNNKQNPSVPTKKSELVH